MIQFRNVLLVIGVAVVAALVLCPPFMVIDRSAPTTRHAALGHHPLWQPPTPAMAEQALVRMSGRPTSGDLASLHIGTNRVRLTLELSGVATAAAAAWLIGRRARRRHG